MSLKPVDLFPGFLVLGLLGYVSVDLLLAMTRWWGNTFLYLDFRAAPCIPRFDSLMRIGIRALKNNTQYFAIVRFLLPIDPRNRHERECDLLEIEFHLFRWQCDLGEKSGKKHTSEQIIGPRFWTMYGSEVSIRNVRQRFLVTTACK